MGPESLRGVLFAALQVHVEAGGAGSLGPAGLEDMEREAEHHAARIEQEGRKKDERKEGNNKQRGKLPSAVRAAL
eukprot:6140604-Pyramimonas_sp.AAC.1